MANTKETLFITIELNDKILIMVGPLFKIPKITKIIELDKFNKKIIAEFVNSVPDCNLIFNSVIRKHRFETTNKDKEIIVNEIYENLKKEIYRKFLYG